MQYSKYTFRLPEQAYVPSAEQALKVVSMRDLSREYIRLRGIAVKSGQRLEDAGYKPGEAFSFPTLTELKAGDAEVDPRVLSKQLARLANYISKPTRTVSGKRKQKAQTIDTLNDIGYDFIEDSNFDEFTNYMDFVRDNYTKRMLSSDEVIMLFEITQKAGIPVEELKRRFDDYIDGLRSAEIILDEWDNSNPMSAEEVRRRMGVK